MSWQTMARAPLSSSWYRTSWLVYTGLIGVTVAPHLSAAKYAMMNWGELSR